MYSWNEAVREAHETWLLTNRISHTLSERIRYSAIEHLLNICHELRLLAAASGLGRLTGNMVYKKLLDPGIALTQRVNRIQKPVGDASTSLERARCTSCNDLSGH